MSELKGIYYRLGVLEEKFKRLKESPVGRPCPVCKGDQYTCDRCGASGEKAETATEALGDRQAISEMKIDMLSAQILHWWEDAGMPDGISKPGFVEVAEIIQGAENAEMAQATREKGGEG